MRKTQPHDKETTRVQQLIAYFSIFIAIILVGYCIINIMEVVNKKDDIEKLPDPWVEAYKQVEKYKVGILFDEITTNEDEYTLLRRESNEFIEEVDKDRAPDAKLEVDTKVNEKTFIDNKTNQKIVVNMDTASLPQNNSLVETGPIYLQDKLLLRYMNKDGELKMAMATFKDKDKKKIKILKQTDLANYKDILDDKLKDKTTKPVEEEKKTINEQDYIKGMSDVLIKMFQANTSDDLNKIESNIIQYFTIEGRETVLDSKKSVKIDKGSSILVSYSTAGKSDTSKLNKNRIYVQLMSKYEGKDVLINVIVKLNDNYRIFDIDII